MLRGRPAACFVPLLPRVVAVPRVVLEDEVAPEIGKAIEERRSALWSRSRCRVRDGRCARQNACGGEGRRLDESAAPQGWRGERPLVTTHRVCESAPLIMAQGKATQ